MLSTRACGLRVEAGCDHNPIRIDIDAAQPAGLPDVIAYGMLVMVWAAKAVTDRAGCVCERVMA